jgi:hypothetical protein
MVGTSPFEAKTVRLINEYFEQRQIPGIAFRLKQSRFYTQMVDVLVDSGNRAHYLAIECKSIDPKKTQKFYFSSWTTDKKGRHQIERIAEFVLKSQRFGILAAEIRHGTGGIPNDIYLIPWSHVASAFLNGEKAVDPAELPGAYPKLMKVDGVLNFESCILALRQF